MNVSGASVLVTGGTGGFGSATVRRLAAAGAKVVIADIAADRGKALADEVGGEAVFVQTDVTDDSSVSEAIRTAAELGPLKAAVVVHGGTTAGRRIIDRAGNPYPAEVFARTMEVFLTATYRVLSLSAAQMATNEPAESGQRGVVITTASIAGYEGQPGQSDYSAAKGGVIALNLTAARDLAPLGIRVMSIAPGTFYTPAFRIDEAEAQEKYGSKVPNPKRMGRVEEYASLAAHIIENDYLNGEVIRIDGAQRFNVR